MSRTASSRLHSLLLLLAGSLAMAGCRASRSTEPPTLTGLTITPATTTLAVALSESLTVVGTYSDGRDTVLTGAVGWTSSATGVARVRSGIATGTGIGSADLTADYNGLSAVCHVVVVSTPPPLQRLTAEPANVSLAIGDHQAFLVTGHYGGGLFGDVTAQVTWSSTASSVAAVTTGAVAALAVGTADLIASIGSVADTVPIVVTLTNEPAGFTPLTDHPFNTVDNSDGIGFGRWSNTTDFGIAQDPTAPRSPPNVAQFTYPAGFQAGSAPGHIEFDLPPNTSKLFISFYMKLSDNFEGQSSETNKVLFAWILDHPAVFLSNQGAGNVPLYPTVRYQGAFDTRAYFRQNVGSPQPMTRGQWRRWELLLIANTPGQQDGVIRFWLDGQRVGEYTDVNFRDTAATWQYVFLQPIWGGVGGTVSATQYLWVDHLYVSGQP
jgi:hypothetical protein